MKQSYFETYQEADAFISDVFRKFGRYAFDGMTVRADGYRVFWWDDRKRHASRLFTARV